MDRYCGRLWLIFHDETGCFLSEREHYRYGDWLLPASSNVKNTYNHLKPELTRYWIFTYVPTSLLQSGVVQPGRNVRQTKRYVNIVVIPVLKVYKFVLIWNSKIWKLTWKISFRYDFPSTNIINNLREPQENIPPLFKTFSAESLIIANCNDSQRNNPSKHCLITSITLLGH